VEEFADRSFSVAWDRPYGTGHGFGRGLSPRSETSSIAFERKTVIRPGMKMSERAALHSRPVRSIGALCFSSATIDDLDALVSFVLSDSGVRRLVRLVHDEGITVGRPNMRAL
jgi:hypothetical protein